MVLGYVVAVGECGWPLHNFLLHFMWHEAVVRNGVMLR